MTLGAAPLHRRGGHIDVDRAGRQIDRLERDGLQLNAMRQGWNYRDPDKNERQDKYYESERGQNGIVSLVITSDQYLHEQKRSQEHAKVK